MLSYLSLKRLMHCTASTAWFSFLSRGHQNFFSQTYSLKKRDQYISSWGHHILRHMNVDLHQQGAPPPHSTRGSLVVANHRCSMDIPVLLSLFGGACLSRSDLKDWPLLGKGAQSVGCLFVDRTSPQSGMMAIRSIQKALKSGQRVILFPEGTTHCGDSLRDFQPGLLACLKKLDVDVIPVGIAVEAGIEFSEDDFLPHLKKLLTRSRLTYSVAIGEQISSTTLRPGENQNKLRQSVQDLINKARSSIQN
jgi:lyso-ornithine lipid O-acyltransferase